MVMALVAAINASSQELFRCRTADGKVAFQDAPCPGGERLSVRPASGGDPLAAPKEKDKLATKIREVDGAIIARKHRHSKDDEARIQAAIDSWTGYAAEQRRIRYRYAPCSTGSTVMCEDAPHNRSVDAELASEFNGLLAKRRALWEEQRALREEFKAKTGSYPVGWR